MLERRRNMFYQSKNLAEKVNQPLQKKKAKGRHDHLKLRSWARRVCFVLHKFSSQTNIN